MRTLHVVLAARPVWSCAAAVAGLALAALAAEIHDFHISFKMVLIIGADIKFVGPEFDVSLLALELKMLDLFFPVDLLGNHSLGLALQFRLLPQMREQIDKYHRRYEHQEA